MKMKHGKSEGYFIFHHDTLYINVYRNELRKNYQAYQS